MNIFPLKVHYYCVYNALISLQVLKIVSELEEGGVGGGTGEGGGGGKAPSSPRGKEKLGHFRAAATALVKVRAGKERWRCAS